MPTRKLFPLLATLLFSCIANAETTPILEKIDTQVEQLMHETNYNKFDYDLQLWKERTAAVFDATADSILSEHKFRSINTLTTPDNQRVFYFFTKKNLTTTLHWWAKSVNGKTEIFSDIVAEKALLASPTVEPRKDGYMLGFQVVCGDETLFWMPDVGVRLAFESISDIRRSDEEKAAALEAIDQKLSKVFSRDYSMAQDFSGLPRLSVVDNKKLAVRVITYMVIYGNFESQCYGWVQHERDGQFRSEKLTDMTAKISAPERVKLSPRKWYGAVYNSMVEIKVGGRTYFTLLGFKSNDSLVKTRVVEVLWFGDNGRTYFGAPIFEHEKATYSRRVFRYSADANMMLRFDEQRQLLVFDHLAPSNSMFIGEYRLYGPDFTQDAYKKSRKGWEFMSDVDLRND